MSFSPVQASRDIAQKYTRYLKTIFSVFDRDYQKQLEAQLDATPFSKGPYLEVTDAFETGETISELISQGVLPKGFDRLGFPSKRPMYRHQIEALHKIAAGRNVVVSTGTGSGKTESFLIPIMRMLVQERNDGTLNAGVRAMLIYPMNALANDQVERLRELLSDFPEITFGCYTGQTKENYRDALEDYKKLNDNKKPLPNELISREQMKDAPPHILITNYAMLEYLMVRPNDSIFFEKQLTQHWSHIVLDEAHVYKGSTGIEVSMLLRRLKARLEKPDIRFILTSATLGGEEDNEGVAKFGQDLCDSPFSAQDVVRAKRIVPSKPDDCIAPPEDFYAVLADLIDADASDEHISEEIRRMIPDAPKNYAEALYRIIRKDPFYWQLRALLQMPKTVRELQNQTGCTEKVLTDFVTVATRAVKNGGKLFDAKYHTFLRAAESVFITLAPSKKLFIEARKKYYEGDQEYKVFEIASCSHCHAIYLLGKEESGILEQSGYTADNDPKCAYLLSDDINDSDDEHTLEDAGESVEEYDICAVCGNIARAGTSHNCGHGNAFRHRVQKVSLKEERQILIKCPCCENVSNSGILRQFFVGQEAATSVVGTSLFESMPSYKVEHIKTEADDDFGFDFEESEQECRTDVGAKQFIAFSDSRQAAAFYATYLDETYTGILYKRLVIEALKAAEYQQGRSISDFAEDVQAQFEHYGIADASAARKEAWKAVLHETSDNNGNTSLYKLGMIAFDIPASRFAPNQRLQLSAEDVHQICSQFADWMMSESNLNYPIPMNIEDRVFFAYSGVEHAYTLSDSNPKKHTLSFLPSRIGLSNKRLDYLKKILSKRGNEISDEDALRLLEGIWKAFFVHPDRGIMRLEDGAYRLDSEKIFVSRPKALYVCKKCRRVTHHNVSGVCPAYHCDGELEPLIPEKYFAGNHYYTLYQTMDIRPLRVVEHTAQLDRETAYDYQKRFKQKQIDILSCSTTFEMGVDVGSLETVFMRNVPPSPANYAQRAGRAGRSLTSAAFALTFCNKSNHDFSYFRMPEQMIKGRIDAPVFNTENDKIAIRHLYASAFSFFWKKYPAYFDNVSGFAEQQDGNPSGIEMFREYLGSRPDELREYAEHFLPAALQRRFDIENFGWTPGLIDPESGILSQAIATYRDDVAVLEEARQNAIEEHRPGVDYLTMRIRNYKSEKILAYLARRNVFPKYGFPVDTVEMNVIDRKGTQKVGLQLSRDLSMAISEYAPGSQVVANGKLITSRYIRRCPNIGWKMSRYCVCDTCKDLNLKPYTEDNEMQMNGEDSVCQTCGSELNAKNRGVYLIPEFGFEAEGDLKKPGLKKPKRTFRSEVSYLGGDRQDDETVFRIGKADVVLAGGSQQELAMLNRSRFFVCESCGYTELNEKNYRNAMKKAHNRVSGGKCSNENLKLRSLAYRFCTDVLTLRFDKPEITDYEQALSILYGILEGASRALGIERNDISGCLKWIRNPNTRNVNYEFVLYDQTPGGAGHVKRMRDPHTLETVLRTTLDLIGNCTCGGEEMETSCYSCLRNYYNQKYHDILRRSHVVNFLKTVFSE